MQERMQSTAAPPYTKFFARYLIALSVAVSAPLYVSVVLPTRETTPPFESNIGGYVSTVFTCVVLVCWSEIICPKSAVMSC